MKVIDIRLVVADDVEAGQCIERLSTRDISIVAAAEMDHNEMGDLAPNMETAVVYTRSAQQASQAISALSGLILKPL